MWSEFLATWNGRCFIQYSQSALSLELHRCVWFRLWWVFRGSWFSAPWPSDLVLDNIAVLELFAVYTAICLWKSKLGNKQILFFSDNEALVHVWSSGSSRCKPLMAIVQALFFLYVGHNIFVSIKHIPGYTNVLAGSLSRLQVRRFKSICHNRHLREVLVPEEMFRLLRLQP